MVGDDRPDLLAAMVRAGIVPDRWVTVVRRDGDRLQARVGGRTVALDAAVAQRVFLVGVVDAMPDSTAATGTGSLSALEGVPS